MADFNNANLEKILFLDIETAPQFETFDKLPPESQKLWGKKSQRLANQEQTAGELYDRAGIYSEFGKIICISAGVLKKVDGKQTLRVKSFAGDDERQLLVEFNQMVTRHFNGPDSFLCGHNGKEFDFPYIARRTLIHGLTIPSCLDTRGLKPWEVKHFDTLELWRFGDFKSYTSLELLTNIFGIPTPKDDIAGDQVAHVYWVERDLRRIATYCQKDVVALVQLFLRFRGEPLVEEAHVTYA